MSLGRISRAVIGQLRIEGVEALQRRSRTRFQTRIAHEGAVDARVGEVVEFGILIGPRISVRRHPLAAERRHLRLAFARHFNSRIAPSLKYLNQK